MNQDLIQRVTQRRLAAITFHKDIVPIQTSSGSANMPAQIVGSWAVHKTLSKPGRWTVTFLPEGMALRSDFTSQSAAIQFITTLLEDVPALLHAQDKSTVQAQKGKILQLLKDAPLAPGAKRGPLVLKTTLNIEGILAEEGLRDLGNRNGKAGDFWGAEGLSRVIAVGRRDVMLNVFLISMSREDHVKRPDTRWTLHRSELKSAMTEETLRKWAQWVRNGATTIELREYARNKYLAGTPEADRYGNRPPVVIDGATSKKVLGNL